MSIFYTRGQKIKKFNIKHYWLKVKDVNSIHKWLKGEKCEHHTQVVKRVKMSTLYTSG